jgi:hypothetical protein
MGAAGNAFKPACTFASQRPEYLTHPRCHALPQRQNVSLPRHSFAALQQSHMQPQSYGAFLTETVACSDTVAATHNRMVNTVHSLSQLFFARRTNPPLNCRREKGIPTTIKSCRTP